MLGGLIHGALWLAAIGLLAIIVVFAIVVGFVRRATGSAHPGGSDSNMTTTRGDDRLR
jgi:hypothetical protein